jgi:hypothetical protein
MIGLVLGTNVRWSGNNLPKSVEKRNCRRRALFGLRIEEESNPGYGVLALVAANLP